MEELLPCPFCEAELFAGLNIRHKQVMRHPYHPRCPLSEAQWNDSPGFRERWNRRAQPEQPETVHGCWEFINDYQARCSACGEMGLIDHDNEYKFCSNCGAKMDGGEKDAAD